MDIDLVELSGKRVEELAPDIILRHMALRSLEDAGDLARKLGASDAEIRQAIERSLFKKLSLLETEILGRSIFNYHALFWFLGHEDLIELGYNELRLTDEPSGREAMRRSLYTTQAIYSDKDPVRGDHNSPGEDNEC